MFNELVELLTPFDVNLGQFVLVIGVVIWAVNAFKKSIKQMEDNHTEKIEEGIEKKQKIDNLVTELSETHTELNNVKNDLDIRLNQLAEEIKTYHEAFSKGNKKIENTINEIYVVVEQHNQKISALESKIKKIESQINLLFLTDKEYVRSYIIEGHVKYVKNEHRIDLISLQNLEAVYNRYLEEGGVNDEFLAKLMKELRNLPTTK